MKKVNISFTYHFFKFYLLAIFFDNFINESNLITKNVQESLSKKSKTPGKNSLFCYLFVSYYLIINEKTTKMHLWLIQAVQHLQPYIQMQVCYQFI